MRDDEEITWGSGEPLALLAVLPLSANSTVSVPQITAEVAPEQ